MSKASRRITGCCMSRLPPASMAYQSPFGPKTKNPRKIKPQAVK
jgi:hypothetical protein